MVWTSPERMTATSTPANATAATNARRKQNYARRFASAASASSRIVCAVAGSIS